MINNKNSQIVLSGSANRALAEKICRYLNVEPTNAEVERFPDGEINVKILDDVRGTDAFVVQSTCPPVNDSLVELLILIDCLKRASAERITAVLPYFGYARQDRKAEGRVPITAKLAANLITAAGANRCLAMDLHAHQIQGFFDIPMDHLYAAPVIVNYFKQLNLDNPVLVAPDVGAIKMARGYAKRLDAELAIIDKRRTGPDETEVMNIIGEVKGREVILVDDMMATGTTITKAADKCHEKGAKSVYICATHPVFAGRAYEKVAKANIEKCVVCDTIPVKKGELEGKLEVLSVGELIGETIRRIHYSESVSSLFG